MNPSSGGAVLLALCPENASINDANEELTNLYQVIKDDVELLIEELGSYHNSKEFFYQIRALDRTDAGLAILSRVQRAARTIYLNRTGYNGMYRVNSKNQFNVPYGSYANPKICNAPVLRALSSYLRRADVTITTGDYWEALESANAGDFVYLDPPYDPLTTTAAFASYTATGFGRAEQIALKECCDVLTSKGVRWLLSNSATDFIKDLYHNYRVDIVMARRNINSKGTGRGGVEEVLVSNYEH